MTIEITGVEIENKRAHIYALDVSEEHRIMIEQGRADDIPVEVEYVFCIENIKYLYEWLGQQKIVRDTKPKTLGDALRCIVGIHTQSPKSIYRVYEDILDQKGWALDTPTYEYKSKQQRAYEAWEKRYQAPTCKDKLPVKARKRA